jgi:hypothetical protein
MRNSFARRSMVPALILSLFLALLGLAGVAQAGIITYTGNDPNVAPGGLYPNSLAAAAAFDAAVGSFKLITFEGLPIGNFATRTVAPGVTVTLTGTDPDPSVNPGISNVNTQWLGYNTTAGGTQHLRVVPPWGNDPNGTLSLSATFAFNTPIVAFGAYLTGTQTAMEGAISLDFNDGSAQTLPVTKNAVEGVQFLGFTDFGRPISSVTFTEVGAFYYNRDVYGIDDLRYGSIPEPGSLALFLIGAAALVLRSLRRRGQSVPAGSG